MMRSRVLFSFFVCLVAAFGCIDPVRLETGNGAGTLVVDGLITDQQGNYTVNLSRSINFDNSRPLRVFAVPEKGATIVISDNTGFTETLKEREAGVYKTSLIRGVVGNSYWINIRTADGKLYHSEPETLPAVVKVDTIKTEFTVYERLIITANKQPRTEKGVGFNIYAVASDPAGLGNFYRWQADGVFEFFSVIDDPTYRTCWVGVNRLESSLVVSDDVLNDGQQFSHLVCVVPYDRPTRYQVKLRQTSLTERAYKYWKASQSQQLSTGSIFDPPPTTLIGNIKGADNNPVLGYFGASALSNYRYIFDRFHASGLVEPYPNPPLIVGRCDIQLPGATLVRPEGF
ncbi:MAG TPA: DUF4249 domain-containing protein [Cyclobacteriaceae bacterium]